MNSVTITLAIDSDHTFCEEQSFVVPEHSSIEHALILWQQQHGDIENIAERKVGIFGAPKPYDYILKDGDRLEIYQPLKIDPKQARRIRAERAPSKR